MECGIAMDWIIDEKELRVIEEGCHIETEWNLTAILDVIYYIRIEEDGEQRNNKTNVCIQLVVNIHESFRIAANFTLSIPSANFCENGFYIFTEEDNTYIKTFSRIAFFDPKNGFIQNGKLTLHLRGTLNMAKLFGVKHVKTVGQIIWKKNEEKDFIIEVDGKEIKAHKFILRERSPYFAAMFDSGMKEARENKVKFEGFPFKIVEAAITICYDSEIDSILTVEDYLLLLEFSHLYDIDHVKTYTESKLAAFLAGNNVCRIANASIEFFAEKLRLCCKNILIDYKNYKNYNFLREISVADFDSLDANLKAELSSRDAIRRFY